MSKTLKRLSISAPCADYETITGILASEINFGWEESGDGIGECRWLVHCENGEFIRALADKMVRNAPEASFLVEEIEDRDWTEAWREFFTPIDAGHFVVLPPWLADNAPQSILIEPKSAFGTGHHASTLLCLLAIGRLVDEGRIAPGGRFLDLGCGTGILAIAAAKCGLSGIAVDNDPLAIENAVENITLNRAQGVETRVGSIGDMAGESFDLVLANILARPLVEMAPGISAALAPSGNLVLSGILDTQAQTVAKAYMDCGLSKPAVTADGEWRALIFGKNGSDFQ